MANLVEQILAQSKAGSAEGESLPVIQAFTAGSNLKTEEVRRRALEQSISFNEKMDALKLTEAQLNMQRIQETTAASGELASYMLDASSSPDGFSNPEVVGKVKSLLLRHPTLIGTPIGTQALGQITAAARLHQLIPGGQTGIDGTKFQPHINAKGEVSYVPVKSSKELALIDAYQSAVKSGDTERADLIKGQLNLRLDLEDVKHLNALQILDLKQQHDVQIQTMRNEARAAIARGEVSRVQFINRHLNTVLSTITKSDAGQNLSVQAANAQAMRILGAAWDAEIGTAPAPPTTAAPAPSAAAPAPPAPATEIRKPSFKWDPKTGQLVPQ